MSQKYLMSDYQRIFSMENLKKESALKVTKRNATNRPSKPRLNKDFNIPTESRERLHRIEQSGVTSSGKEQLGMKQRESVELKESAKNARAKESSSESHLLYLQPTV